MSVESNAIAKMKKRMSKSPVMKNRDVAKSYNINLPNEGTFYCVRVMQFGTPRYDLVGGNPISSENPLNIYGYDTKIEATLKAMEYLEANPYVDKYDIELLHIDMANYRRWEKSKKQYANWDTYEAQFVALWYSIYNLCLDLMEEYGDSQYMNRYFKKSVKKSRFKKGTGASIKCGKEYFYVDFDGYVRSLGRALSSACQDKSCYDEPQEGFETLEDFADYLRNGFGNDYGFKIYDSGGSAYYQYTIEMTGPGGYWVSVIDEDGEYHDDSETDYWWN